MVCSGAWKAAVIVTALLLVAAGISVALQTGNSTSQPEGIEVSIFTQQSSTAIPIVVKSGSQFVIKLASNQTTGYKWQLAKQPSAGVAKLISSTYNSPNTGRLGQGGSEWWTFRAVGKGKTSITLNYLRPWEKNTPPTKSQSFAVTVQ